MNKTRLFYVIGIILCLRFGIEYNLYLIQVLNENYPKISSSPFQSLYFIACFLFYPVIFYFLLTEVKPKTTPLEFHKKMEKDRKNIIGRKGILAVNLKNLDVVGRQGILAANLKHLKPNICWSCESESDIDSLFCMTCGIELNLNKSNEITIKESNIEIQEK